MLERIIFFIMISIGLFSCEEKPVKELKNESKTGETTGRWFPRTRVEADSTGHFNWIDENGKRQGWWMINAKMISDTIFPTDLLMEEGAYVDDVKEGEWISYDPQGRVVKQIRYMGGREVK